MDLQKCKEIITHKNAVFIDDKFPSAKEMAKLSYDKHKKNDIENVAYFEPFYLKDFVVIPQKKKETYFINIILYVDKEFLYLLHLKLILHSR